MKNISFYKVYKRDVDEIVEVDLSSCKNDKDIFDVFKKSFRFPDWFGENWDAFHDCITSLCFDVKDVLVVKIYGLQNVFLFSKDSANLILEDLIVLANGEATQDNGSYINAIIYLFDIDTNCEKLILNKDLSGLEFVSNDQK